MLMNNSELSRIYRENAWRHFSVHADQRLKMFQFYITISTALLGAAILLYRTGQSEVAIILLGFLASFFSFVFWKLEARTRTLVRNAEDAIKYLDESAELPFVDHEPNPLKLFTRDDFRNAMNSDAIRSPFSYHKCFGMVFVLIACLGTLGIGYGVFELVSDSKPVKPAAVERTTELSTDHDRSPGSRAGPRTSSFRL